MKIIHTLDAPHRIIYAGEAITLTEQGATSQSGSFDATTTTANAVLVDGVELPAHWVGNAYGYTDDAFVLLSQALIDAAYPPAPVPAEVTMRQARLALLGVGKLDDVDTAIDGLPEPQRSAARIEWDYSSTVRRQQPLVLALAPALGLSSEDLDNLFRAAGAL